MEIKEREIFKEIDWVLIVIVILLICSGIVAVYSATINFKVPFMYFGKQLLGLILGLSLMLVLIGFNYLFFKQYHYYVYALSILFLVLVLIFGKQIHGTRAWIDFKFFSFQPSEITKILFILSLSAYLDKEWKQLFRWQKLFIPVVMLLGNIGLILLQPDFSGIIIYFPVMLVMLFCANVRIIHILAIVLYGLVAVGLPLSKTVFISKFPFSSVIKFFQPSVNVFLAILIIGLLLLFFWWFLNQLKISIPLFYFICIFFIIVSGVISSYVVEKSLKEYQKKRLIAFIDPKIDPLGTGYNIIQSKIAVGSGRLFGKGIFSGTQGQLGFIPARHTDFIFSLFAEENGFLLSIVVISLYFSLIYRSVYITKTSRNRYGSLVASGISAMFAFYCIINIGMVMGLMPVTGLPLPFMSYGGSSLVSSFMAIGILLSIHLRRFVY